MKNYVVFKKEIDLLDIVEIIKNIRGIASKNLCNKEGYYEIITISSIIEGHNGNKKIKEIFKADILIKDVEILILAKVDKNINTSIIDLQEFMKLALQLIIGLKVININPEFIEEERYLYCQYYVNLKEVVKDGMFI